MADPQRIRVAVRRHGAFAAGATSERQPTEDWVAVEEPLEVRVRWSPSAAGILTETVVSITMRTPGDDRHLAAGLLYSEALIRSAADLAELTEIDAHGIAAALRPGLAVDADRLTRHTVTGSACGVCGKTSLEALRVPTPYPARPLAAPVSPAVIARLTASLQERQPGFRETGGLHAAALFALDGALLDVREDVGRHNALDKLIGAALLNGGLPWAEHGVLVSGRASFEIIQKARMAGCPLVVAVGAPSSLAVELAWESGMTLAGFLRDGRFNVYTGPAGIGA